MSVSRSISARISAHWSATSGVVRPPLGPTWDRATVGRADSWRQRMDTTTHWAIGATAGVVSFALGNPAAPHYVVHLASFLTAIFLLLEARRLLRTDGASVTTVAFDVGYESPSQFSREYARKFGVPPSREPAAAPRSLG